MRPLVAGLSILALSLPLSTHAQCVTPPAGLVSWWRAEGNPLDHAEANPGTLAGNAAFGPGLVGQAFVLDGDRDGVNVGAGTNLWLQNFSIEAWVKRASSSILSFNGNGNGTLFGVGIGGGYSFYLDAGGHPTLGKMQISSVSANTTVTDTNWHHLAVTKAQSSVVFYVDGMAYPAPAYEPGFVFGSAAVVGAWTHDGIYDNTFYGSIDDLAVYNRALSTNEIGAIYQAGSTGKCTSTSPPDCAPVITAQPASKAVAAGAPAVFAVTAAGTPPLSYQWLFNEALLSDSGPITGSTSSILNFSAARTNDAGSYRVVVSNAFGMATSSVATLTVGLPPVITAQPQAQTVRSGSNATFSVLATGTEPLSYQWFLNGGILANDSRHSGADSSTLAISNVQPADAGSYTVTVSNFAATLVSTSALLTVLVPPAFVSQPLGCSVPLGMPASFSASFSGNAPLSCQWQLDGVDIPGATNDSLTIPAVAAADFGLYTLLISNSVGTAVSDPAPLTWGPVAAWGYNSSGQTLVPVGLTNVTTLAAGGVHSLALRTDGTVAAWGGNTYGQTNLPPDLANVIAVAAGGYHSLALRSGGTVVSWGRNTYGQANTPAGLSNVVAIAAGASHSLALRADGSVVAWGLTSYNLTSAPNSLYDNVAIASGFNHALALRSDGTVVGWGYNNFGQTNVPVGLSNVVAIAAGGYHTLALRADGSVVAWGMNSSGQTSVPANLTNAIAITAGDYHSLALRADGTALAWGRNDYGQTNSFPSLTNLVAIAAGGSHNLALLGDGRPLLTRQPASVTSWTGRSLALRAAAVGAAPLSFQWQKDGVSILDATNATLVLPALALSDQASYQLLVTNSLGAVASLPVTVTVLEGVAPFFLSRLPSAQTNYLGSGFVLGFSVGGSGPFHYQWRFKGQNLLGATRHELVFDPVLLTNAGAYSLFVTNQFGAATSASDALNVIQVKAWGYMSADPPASASNVVAVAVGVYNYLAVRADGKVVGWGSQGPGPVTVPASLSNVVAIAAGYDHSAALRSDGSVFVWGSTYYGQSNVPPTASSVVAIAAGYSHDLALRSDGTVVAWGYNNYGQTAVPTNLTGVVAIAAGSGHSLALKADGTVVGWGYSSSFQPIPPSATNLISIAAGAFHCLALRADGTVAAWGQYSSGAAIVPPGLSNVVAIAAGANHSAALRSDGTIVTWGSPSSAVPLPDMANAIQIAAGGEHGLMLFGNRSPAVTVQPFSRTLFRGTNTAFVAKVSGAQPLTYQWRFKGADIPGATADTLTLTNLQFSQAGAYQLLVSNSYGAATTLKAKLMITLPLAEALDTTNFTWTSSGSAQWYGQPETAFDSLDAARSGAINNGQESILQTSVVGPGRLFWRWKVSSEANFDKLEFRYKGLSQAAISGEVDWEQCSFDIPAGAQIAQWRYSKDVSFGDGQDAAWVDQVGFIPAPLITGQPGNRTVSMGAQVFMPVFATGTPPLSYQWLHNGTPVASATSSVLTLTNAARSDNGTYAVLVSNPGGTALSSNALLKVLIPQQLGSPTFQPDGSLLLTAGYVDGGLLSPADLARLEAQTSTNLVLWETLPGSLTLSNGLLQLQDTNTPNYPCRFYRIFEK